MSARTIPTFSDFLASRRPAPSTPCAWCGDAAGEHPATPEHVVVARAGALSVDDLLCRVCREDFDADVAREVSA